MATAMTQWLVVLRLGKVSPRNGAPAEALPNHKSSKFMNIRSWLRP